MKYLKLVRAHQWIKNLLCLVPLFASGKFFDFYKLESVFLGILSISFTASAGYIFNDLHDIQSDLNNPYKQHRPLAAGLIAEGTAKFIGFCLLLIGISIGISISILTGLFLILYLTIVITYTLMVKNIPIIGVMTLSSFYLFRVFFGGLVSDISVSFWLAMFVTFFFFGLALSKKVSDKILENVTDGLGNQEKELYIIFGILSSFVAVLTLALYINDPLILYRFNHEKILWATIPLTLYFIMRFWSDCIMGEIKTDPVSYCIKNRKLVITLLLILTLYELATFSF